VPGQAAKNESGSWVNRYDLTFKIISRMMTKILSRIFLLCLFIHFSLLTTGQQLSSMEKEVIKWIDQHRQEAVELLRESANINSGSLNLEGVKKTGAVFQRELEKAGFTCLWIPMPDSMKRAGHLVATRKGKKGKKLFLIGHLDTVFEPDMPFTPFTLLNDSTATGQGVNDMKGGNVIMVMALQALNQYGLLKDATITVYLTGDEEWAGHPRSISRGDFIERAKDCDVALGFEGAVGLNTITTARRGIGDWKLVVEANTGHSSGIFRESAGYGAIFEAARILNEFRTTLSAEKYLTFNPGLILGGSEISFNPAIGSGQAIGKTNIISPSVTVTGDLRFLSEEQKEKTRQTMREITSRSLPGTKATISFQDGIPAMAPTPGNEKLVPVVDRISRDLGYGETTALDPGMRGAGDISYVAAYLDCLDGFGASGQGAHAPGETIDLNTMPFLTKRAALVIHRLVNEK
jgi:glutamate carboxypeptidase